MYRLFLVFTLISLACCREKQSKLFEEVKYLAELEGLGEAVLIQYGEEDGFLEPLMTYGLFSIDSVDFEKLLNAVRNNENFKAGSYYLNVELDAYLSKNELEILNMSNSLITRNKYDNTYYLYLLSDNKSFAICKVNH